MNFTEYLSELAYPVRSLGTAVSLISFFLLLSLASAAGLIGLWLAILVLPAMFRYLILLVQARARGSDASPIGAEYFSPVASLWTLYVFVPMVFVALGWRLIDETFGVGAGLLFGLFSAAIIPAMMAVLAITQSPAQSLNPVALSTLVRETGASYLFGPATFILALLAPRFLSWIPGWSQSLIELYLVFAFFAVIGATMRRRKLIEEVYIDEPLQADAETQLSDLDKQRTGILDHAYGFVSRGNREGGLTHIYSWLREDPNPEQAWEWFFEQMLKWEQERSALFYAQRYLSRLLAVSEPVKAVKLVLRCQILDETFRPLRDDIPATIDAALHCGNTTLADALKRL